MASELIKQLLVLQEADVRAAELERDVKRIPLEIEVNEDKIQAQRGSLKAAEDAIKVQETQRKQLDSEVEAIEAKIIKFKTQQLEVKKNEEYEALTHEIEAAEAKISELEDQELTILMEIDAAKEALEALKADVSETISSFQSQIAALKQQEAECKAQIDEAREHFKRAVEKTDPRAKNDYDNVKRSGKKAPYVVDLKGNTCNGCHLRISNDNMAAVRDRTRIVRCDNCGRIVF